MTMPLKSCLHFDVPVHTNFKRSNKKPANLRWNSFCLFHRTSSCNLPKQILGIKTYKSVLDVPEDIDIAIFVIPGKFVNQIAEECGKKGLKGLVVITAGFKEIGGEGIKREHELIQVAKKHGMRIIGPNCLGFIGVNYNGSFAAHTPKKGEIAMISQSGAMLTGMMDYSIDKLLVFRVTLA